MEALPPRSWRQGSHPALGGFGLEVTEVFLWKPAPCLPTAGSAHPSLVAAPSGQRSLDKAQEAPLGEPGFSGGFQSPLDQIPPRAERRSWKAAAFQRSASAGRSRSARGSWGLRSRALERLNSIPHPPAGFPSAVVIFQTPSVKGSDRSLVAGLFPCSPGEGLS